MKLKIHFLEESLRKSGPGINEAALKENADLKVGRVTMQKELARARKTLEKTEHEVEEYRKEVQAAHEQTKRKHADKKMLEEVDSLRREVVMKDSRIQAMRDDLDRFAEKDTEIEKLRGDIDDLEIDVQEKERLLDDRDDEIEGLKEKRKQDADELAEALHKIDSGNRHIGELEQAQRSSADRSAQFHDVNEELADAREHIQDLERKVEQAAAKAEDADDEAQEARQAKEKAEADLDEVCQIDTDCLRAVADILLAA